MTPDEQEAASVRYVAAVLVVPLASGRWAIYSRDFSTLVAIVESLSEAETLIRETVGQALAEKARREKGSLLQISGKSLENLGL